MGQVIDLGKVIVTPRGSWNERALYEYLSIVEYEGRGYLSLRDNYGSRPHPEGTRDWMLLADRGTADVELISQEQIDQISNLLTPFN